MLFERLLNNGMEVFSKCGVVQGPNFKFTLKGEQCLENVKMIVDNLVIKMDDLKQSGLKPDFGFTSTKIKELLGYLSVFLRNCGKK